MQFLFKIVLVLITFCLFFSTAQATTYYRHAPFHLSLGKTDTLIVNYDFTGKGSLSCQADSGEIWMVFSYKGKQKSARLPVTLIHHIPEKEHEELADIRGQCNLTVMPGSNPSKSHLIQCHYL